MPFTLYALYLRQKQLFSYLVYKHIRTVSGTVWAAERAKITFLQNQW